MAYPTRPTVGPVLKKQLAELGLELEGVLAAKKAAADRESEIKTKIKEIVSRYDLPVAEGPSQYLDIPDTELSLAVVRPERSVTVVPEKLRERVGDDLFHLLCVIKTVAFDMSKWALLKDEERVTDADLVASLPAEDPAEVITIKLAKARGKKKA